LDFDLSPECPVISRVDRRFLAGASPSLVALGKRA
jgi:hypothetical protein